MSKPIFGVKPHAWAKHLRPVEKNRFWNTVRQRYAQAIQKEASELQIMQTLENELFQEI